MFDVDKVVRLVEERLNELGESTKIDGEIWRAIYTKEEKIGKALLRKWMEEAGMECYEDGIGNLFGRIEGKAKETVLIGSHMDTVRDGGKYDGALGIVAGISAVVDLIPRKGRPDKTIELVAMVEEEASRFPTGYLGSKTITGKMTDLELEDMDQEGKTLVEVMKSQGYKPEALGQSKRDDLNSYIEIHVEQGPVLENNNKKIGIVENIVGLVGYVVKISGRQDHAGTTPMDMRMDPLVEASEFLYKLTQEARKISDTATFTIGKMNVLPGMANVVVREVEFTIDLRDSKRQALIEISGRIDEFLDIIRDRGFEVEGRKLCNEMPVALDSNLASKVEDITVKNNIPYMRMNSGAGHDAQIFAEEVATCLIFVPSKNGRSHCSEEYTAPEDLGYGVETLSHLIEELAWD